MIGLQQIGGDGDVNQTQAYEYRALQTREVMAMLFFYAVLLSTVGM